MRTEDYRNPSLTVDGIVVDGDRILLIRRGNEPFKGHHALPGGFVDYGETVEDAVTREVLEETGLVTEISWLLGVYSNPDRDPRGHTVSVVYVMDLAGGMVQAGDDAEEAEWFPLESLPRLAFDHGRIIDDYIVSTSRCQPQRGA